QAGRATEIVGPSIMGVRAARCRRIDRHAADGISGRRTACMDHFQMFLVVHSRYLRLGLIASSYLGAAGRLSLTGVQSCPSSASKMGQPLAGPRPPQEAVNLSRASFIRWRSRILASMSVILAVACCRTS